MLIYLEPLSIFPELHSDTLFGAITYAISELFSKTKVEEMFNDFKEEPPFLISSTFPYAFKGDTKIRFYPKVIFNNGVNNEIPIENIKTYKKIDFIEEEIFFKLINGEINENDIISSLDDDFKRIKNLLMTKEYDLDIGFNENIIPNNSVNRITNETKIFYTMGNEFKNLGLFFIVEFNNEEYKPLVKAAIKFLKDRGFGADISVGKGHFDFEIDEDYSITDLLKNHDSMDYFITLSRYIPKADELFDIKKFSSYELGSKRGISRNKDLRKQVRFFKEGSIFKYTKKYYGTIMESGNKEPAIEYGFAFPLKCVGNKDE